MYLILLSLHTITVLPLTTVYIVSEVHCTFECTTCTLYITLVLCYIIYKCKGNSHITTITVQSSTIVLHELRCTVDYHLIKV